MMNAGIFLVPTVHEIAIAAEVAIAARTAEKSDTYTLPNRPALDTGTKRIDPPDELVSAMLLISPRNRSRPASAMAATVAGRPAY